MKRLRERIDLRAGTDVEATVQRVSSEASLSPESLWLLAGSAILASIGLDLSSAAVIIGAMLISPLMGPIIGVGLGLGITDRALLQRSLRELLLATVFTIAVSAAYFLLSPLSISTAELVARTRPTLLDVGVAFVGGVAGIVAGSRRKQSLALPGVAIATALMPPLCTAGFGLATGNWAFLFGAFYLYALNAVFIALSTFLIVRLLRFPHHQEVTPEGRRREHLLVTAVAVLATLPSMYFLYDAVRDVREHGRIESFVRREVEAPGREVLQWERERIGTDDVLKLYLAGHPVDSITAASLRERLPRAGLDGLRLEFVQSEISTDDLRRFQTNVQRDLLRTVSATLAARDSSARLRDSRDTPTMVAAARELVAAFPEIEQAAYTPRLDLLAPDSIVSPPAYFVTFSREARPAARRDILARAQALLRGRLGLADLRVLER